MYIYYGICCTCIFQEDVITQLCITAFTLNQSQFQAIEAKLICTMTSMSHIMQNIYGTINSWISIPLNILEYVSTVQLHILWRWWHHPIYNSRVHFNKNLKLHRRLFFIVKCKIDWGKLVEHVLGKDVLDAIYRAIGALVITIITVHNTDYGP